MNLDCADVETELNSKKTVAFPILHCQNHKWRCKVHFQYISSQTVRRYDTIAYEESYQLDFIANLEINISICIVL